ncbi:MAG: hypothetical protein L3J28_04965 [Candidatus Polarisedimenticolaceae bacterium]|nr:hypothetical protein [Candidatus Polarisedimenticolaceae bacterium]
MRAGQGVVPRWLFYTALLWVLFSAQPLLAKPASKGEVTNLAYGEVLYQFYQQNYFEAIVHLTAALQKSPMREQGSDAELLLGGLYLSYGMHNEAERILNRLLLEQESEVLHDRIQFHLAKSRYRRGLQQAAERSLQQIKGSLPDSQQQEQQLIYGQLLLDQMRNKEAVAQLSSLQGDSIWALYGQYNLAIAQLRLGEIEQGQALLDRLSRIETTDEEQIALRDRAKLTLGSWLLQQGELDLAKRTLSQIRIKGLLSSEAILATGWGYAEQENYPEALAHWVALSERSSTNPVVQDALLAIPYAFLQLNAKPQAVEHYNNAIEIYQREMAEIVMAQDRVQSAVFTQRYLSKPDQQPDDNLNSYLQPILISHPFQTALQSLRDLLAIEENLSHWSSELTTFDTMLAARQQNYQQKLPLLDRSTAIEQFQKLQQKQQQQRLQLNQITADDDALALATSKERRSLARLDLLEGQLPQLAEQIDQADLQQRIHFFRGILLWQASSDFKGRRWSAEEGLLESERLLEEIKQKQAQLKAIRDQQPAKFSRFKREISATAEQITYLQPVVAQLINMQRAEITSASLAYLKQQQQRLESYLTQAQFAIAQIHDDALKQAEAQAQ